jgi:hypothetical protein
LLLDERAWGDVAARIDGTVSESHVLAEYSVGLSPGFTRRLVRHYVVDGDKISRVDPVALGPRDFVDEWLKRDWVESAGWTEARNRAALGLWHGKGTSIDFENTTSMHCGQSPDLWQVVNNYSADANHELLEYYLVRWRPPYRFTMVDVSKRPWPGCVEPDSQADEERTLFAGRN